MLSTRLKENMSKILMMAASGKRISDFLPCSSEYVCNF